MEWYPTVLCPACRQPMHLEFFGDESLLFCHNCQEGWSSDPNPETPLTEEEVMLEELEERLYALGIGYPVWPVPNFCGHIGEWNNKS